MQYIQPYDQPANPTAPYVDINVALGVDGSVPPADFFNHVSAELLAIIQYAGITPSSANLHQVLDAILSLLPSPTGGPSDASLVHWGIDNGSANAPNLTISPSAAGVGPGFIVFFLPAGTSTGVSTLAINLSPSGSVVKPLLRANGAAIMAGDLEANRLAVAQYDGANFRLLTTRRPVRVDATLTGDGVDTPLSVVTAEVTDFGVGTYLVASAPYVPNIPYGTVLAGSQLIMYGIVSNTFQQLATVIPGNRWKFLGVSGATTAFWTGLWRRLPD